MTDADIALCLAMLDQLNAADLDGLIAHCHDDVECEPFLAQVEGEAFFGADGMRRWWAERAAAWETIQVEPGGEPRRVGTHLLMPGIFHTRARESGVEMDVPFFQAAQVRGDKVAWWGVYATEEEALRRISERDGEL